MHKNISQQQISKIRDLLRGGISIDEVHKHTIYTKKHVWYTILNNIELFNVCDVSANLGTKKEPYYKTEKEMLNKPIYDYKGLSKSEKAIYNLM